eukprot:352983-Hanusia_phi.AAC.2
MAVCLGLKVREDRRWDGRREEWTEEVERGAAWRQKIRTEASNKGEGGDEERRDVEEGKATHEALRMEISDIESKVCSMWMAEERRSLELAAHDQGHLLFSSCQGAGLDRLLQR